MAGLFYAPPSCSLASMIALEATGVAYEPVLVDLTGERAELRKLDPAGKVPLLRAGSFTLSDTVAIIFWLDSRFPEAALLPRDGDALARALSITAWFGSSAAPRYWHELERVDGWLVDEARADFFRAVGVAAYALLFFHWARQDRLPVENLRHYGAYAEAMLDHPYVVQTLKRHASPLLAPLQ